MERKFIDAGQLIREIKRMSRSDSSTREVHVMIIESHEAIVSHSIKDALQARNEVLVTFSSETCLDRLEKLHPPAARSHG